VKAVVVADGEPDGRDVDQLVDAELIVAADGGARWLDSIGVRPHHLVGDLDSVATELVARLAADGVVIERHAVDKEASDAELALDIALASRPDEIVVLGALGGDRLDHELANLFLLADPSRRVPDLRVVRGGTVVRALHGGERLSLLGANGDLVSLLPIGGDAAGVRTHGLRFPLVGEDLHLGPTRGLSNVVTDPPASVSLKRGTLLVVETAIAEESS